MSNRIIIACILWISVCTAVVLAGCSAEGRSTTYGLAERDTLRIKLDSAHERIWVLDLDAVRVYDSSSKRLAHTIPLPRWSVARFGCMPDMVLDRTGSVYVSSNVQPKLWQIDADSFQVRELGISLQGRENWDVGFGAIAFAADGNLLALTSMGRWFWKIDVAGGGARPVELDAPVTAVCDFTTQLVSNLERNRP